MGEETPRTAKPHTPTRSTAFLETTKDLDAGGFYVNFSPTSHNGFNFAGIALIGKDGKFLY